MIISMCVQLANMDSVRKPKRMCEVVWEVPVWLEFSSELPRHVLALCIAISSLTEEPSGEES